MSTSKPPGGQGGGNQPGGHTPNSYARFIPREELGSFAAWNPDALEQPKVKPEPVGGVRKPTLAERAAAEVRPPKSNNAQHAHQTARPMPPQPPASTQAGPQAAPRRPIVGGMPGQAEAEARAAAQASAPPPSGPPPAKVEEMVNTARQSGYQDGYRNGLAALESYKQTQAAQMAAFMNEQVGSLANVFHQRLESLEQQLAGRIAGVALELARQVVRSELRQRPEVVVEVAEEAMGVLLSSARQIALRLNPDDHALAHGQLAEMLGARGARLIPDMQVTRGGCIVESDIAVVDATVEARWERAAAGLGHQAPWNGGKEALGDTEVHLPEGEDELDNWPVEHKPEDEA
jgi:flagellar assembly protein FliH